LFFTITFPSRLHLFSRTVLADNVSFLAERTPGKQSMAGCSLTNPKSRG
jgi:hypothetical protein